MKVKWEDLADDLPIKKVSQRNCDLVSHFCVSQRQRGGIETGAELLRDDHASDVTFWGWVLWIKPAQRVDDDAFYG